MQYFIIYKYSKYYKLNYNKLEILREQKKVNKRKIAKQINMSDVGYAKMIENKSCDVATLEAIANYFKVPITYFFDKDENEVNLGEPEEKYNSCPNCKLKQAEINRLKADNEVLQRKYTSCLEDLLGKKNVC